MGGESVHGTGGKAHGGPCTERKRKYAAGPFTQSGKSERRACTRNRSRSEEAQFTERGGNHDGVLTERVNDVRGVAVNRTGEQVGGEDLHGTER